MRKYFYLMILMIAPLLVTGQMNYKEQLDVINNNGGFTFPSSDYTLNEFVAQATTDYLSDFIFTQKDTSADALAASYLQKMKELAYTHIRRPDKVNERATPVIISFIADSYTFAQVQASTEIQWVTVIDAKMNITMAVLAGATPAEYAAYNAL